MRDILRVNMTDLSTSWEPVPEGWSLYGGRALTDAIIYKEVPADSDPLGPANVLVFAPGMLGGTTAPNGGRLSVGAKSPLTGGIKESNSGGQAAHSLARLGIAAVAVTGIPADPAARYTLTIEADRTVKLERTDAWAGLGNYEVAEAIAATRPEGDRYATITNGPAGELLARAAGIAISDMKNLPNRFAGRGGLGAVMGSKGLKAIVISDKGASFLEHADKEAFVEATKKFSTAIKEHGVSGTGLPMYGTNVLMNILSEAGGLPTRNFTVGHLRVRRCHRRRDPARHDSRARRRVEPWMHDRLRHQVLSLLDGQRRSLQDQGSGVRDRMVVRCGLRHQGPRRDRRARPDLRRSGPRHHRDGRHVGRLHGLRRHPVR